VVLTWCNNHLKKYESQWVPDYPILSIYYGHLASNTIYRLVGGFKHLEKYESQWVPDYPIYEMVNNPNV
jgi:hypothetical protein